VVNKKTINVEIKTKRMTVVNSLSFKVGIILLIIWLFVFIGYLEAFGGKRTYRCKNVPTYCYPGQERIVCVSKNIVRVSVKSGYQQKFPIEIGARLGPYRSFSKSKNIPIILCIFIAVWGTAIIFVLGLLLYRIVIEPQVKKESKDRMKSPGSE